MCADAEFGTDGGVEVPDLAVQVPAEAVRVVRNPGTLSGSRIVEVAHHHEHRSAAFSSQAAASSAVRPVWGRSLSTTREQLAAPPAESSRIMTGHRHGASWARAYEDLSGDGGGASVAGRGRRRTISPSSISPVGSKPNLR